MYEKYLISSNQVYIYGILIAAVVGLIVYLYSLNKKQGQKAAATSFLKTFGILAIGLIVIGLQCRKGIYTIDYNAMVYDKTIKYASVINFLRFDDSTTIKGLQKFMTGNKPASAKDSLKYKCKLITSMYISFQDDLISHIGISYSDTFSISNKTKDIYSRYIIGNREKELADSLLMPLINELNNTKSEVWVRLRIAQGFGEVEELNNMKASIKENQDKIKNYFYSIFKEEIK